MASARPVWPVALCGSPSTPNVASVGIRIASAVSSGGLAVFVLVVTMIYALVGARSLQERARGAYGPDHKLIMGIERFGVDLRRGLVLMEK